MPTKYINVNGHAVYMHYAGKTTLPDVIPDFSRGRTVVMVHGAGGNGHSWHKQIAHLAEAQQSHRDRSARAMDDHPASMG